MVRWFSSDSKSVMNPCSSALRFASDASVISDKWSELELNYANRKDEYFSEQLRGFVDAQVNGGSYGSASEFVRELIRNEQRRQAQSGIALFVQAGIESGNKGEWTPDQFNALRKTFREAVAVRAVK